MKTFLRTGIFVWQPEETGISLQYSSVHQQVLFPFDFLFLFFFFKPVKVAKQWLYLLQVHSGRIFLVKSGVGGGNTVCYTLVCL